MASSGWQNQRFPALPVGAPAVCGGNPYRVGTAGQCRVRGKGSSRNCWNLTPGNPQRRYAGGDLTPLVSLIREARGQTGPGTRWTVLCPLVRGDRSKGPSNQDDPPKAPLVRDRSKGPNNQDDSPKAPLTRGVGGLHGLTTPQCLHAEKSQIAKRVTARPICAYPGKFAKASAYEGCRHRYTAFRLRDVHGMADADSFDRRGLNAGESHKLCF